MEESEWLAADQEVQNYVSKNAHIYLDNQVKLATAADQRASSLAGAFSASATAVLAVLAATEGLLKSSVPHIYPIIAAAIVTSAAFLMAAAFCVSAILPRAVWLPGSAPESWYGDIKEKWPLNKCLYSEVKYLQEKIDENRLLLQSNARSFKRGALIGTLAPLFGIATWVIISSAYWF